MTQSKIISAMTPPEILTACQGDSPLSRVRALVSQHYAEMDGACRQQHPPTPVEYRRMELQAANAICALFGVGLE